MNRLVRLGFVFGLMTGAVLPLQAETDKVTNVPDSVSLFSYARADGQSGLRFAWSPDGEQWLSVADGYDYVKCDFGPWGREKKMFAPICGRMRPTGRGIVYGRLPAAERCWHMPLRPTC